MKEVFVEKVLLGNFRAITKERADELINDPDNGVYGVEIASENEIKITIVFHTLFVIDQNDLNHLALKAINNYIEYVSSITGMELKPMTYDEMMS